MDNIIDSKTGNSTYDFLRKTTCRIGILIIGLVVINLILSQIIPLESRLLLKPDGTTSTVNEMRKMNILSTALILCNKS